jgi:general secretion pathway protein D
MFRFHHLLLAALLGFTPATGGLRAQAAPDTGKFDPAPRTRLLPLPKLPEAQIRELVHDFCTHYQLSAGFSVENTPPADIALPPGVIHTSTLRTRVQGTEVTMLMGYALPPRRLPQLWVAAWTGSVREAQDWSGLSSGDVEKTLQAFLAERGKLLSRLPLGDLEARVLNLSYVDADAALFALRAMGFAAITDTEALPRDDAYKGEDPSRSGRPGTAQEPGTRDGNSTPSSSFSSFQGYQGLTAEDFRRTQPKFPAIRNLPSSIALDRLPLVVRMPATEARNMGLVGAQQETNANNSSAQQRDPLGLSMVPQAASTLTETVTGGTSQLLALFHPDYPDQFTRLRNILQSHIDRPARQVFIEGLVLEVSSEDLSELGVKWDLKKGNQNFSLGTLATPAPGEAALSWIRDATASVTPSQMMARLTALVQANRAEVLSRPSVITLDNRQATIRVGTDIPVATSKDASAAGSGSTRVAFSFQYIPTGILMNVRPRISEDAQEISLLIDATVSSAVPNQDLKVLDPGTRVTLASAPTISTRRVQTYARIRDGMPLIIGGLVSRDQVSAQDKVPLAGDVPLLGKLFGHEMKKESKREVIIVLTPVVVTENVRETKAQSPRDDERFDLKDTVLFKPHYRIRAEDLVDSSYIRFNRRFLSLRESTNQRITRDPASAARPELAALSGNRVPAENIFVIGMMYRLLDRIKAEKPIHEDNLLTYVQGTAGTPEPVSISTLLARMGNGSEPESFFRRHPGKALALTYRLARNSTDPADSSAEPSPDIELVDCPNRTEWRRLLWELNTRPSSIPRYTILIQDPTDLRRLRLAIATQNTVLNNGGVAGMVFDRWLPGRMIHLQEVSASWDRLILAPIAQYFFIGEFAVPYFMREHEAALRRAETALDGAVAQ